MQLQSASLKEVMDSYKKTIHKEVFNYITPTHLHSVSTIENDDILNFFWEQIADYPNRGGKYVRSILICLTCEALGGSLAQALPTAAAMELSQNWILIHDDIEDSSVLRRGKKAHHLIYNVNQSINAGDALHMIMWKALNDNFKILDLAKANAVFDEFYMMLMRTCVGQTAEMDWRDSYSLTEQEVNYILDGKTGYYTIAGPIRLGAIIAGKSPDTDKDLFSAIDEFGLNLGRAFQITDDILDLVSDFSGLKQKGNDIQEGKRSLLFIRLQNLLKDADLVTFKSIMDKPIGEKSQEEIDQIIGLMEQYNVIADSKQEALTFAAKSKAVLDNKLPFSSDIKKIFSEFIEFLVQRSY